MAARHTGAALGDLGGYVPLTNFVNFLEIFPRLAGANSSMKSTTNTFAPEVCVTCRTGKAVRSIRARPASGLGATACGASP